MRLFHLLNGALSGLLLGFSAAALPVHPGYGFWSWFLLPLIGVGSVALSYGCAALITRKPHLVNLPDKRRLLSLPRPHQEPVVRLIRQTLYMMSTFMLVMFGLIQIGLSEAARGNADELYLVAALVVAIASTPVLLLGWLPRIQTALTRAEKELEQETRGG